MTGMIISYMLRGLGPLNGWKTWAGIGLAVIDAIAQYFNVVPAALPTGLTEIIPTILIVLGIGHKMGKHPNPADGSLPKGKKGKK